MQMHSDILVDKGSLGDIRQRRSTNSYLDRNYSVRRRQAINPGFDEDCLHWCRFAAYDRLVSPLAYAQLLSLTSPTKLSFNTQSISSLSIIYFQMSCIHTRSFYSDTPVEAVCCMDRGHGQRSWCVARE
ncbi:hypothetical protein IG631_15634 [Alternaria alternata]|nr:hypothetical protein IG631_15634 [Alternaria alternata]